MLESRTFCVKEQSGSSLRPERGGESRRGRERLLLGEVVQPSVLAFLHFLLLSFTGHSSSTFFNKIRYEKDQKACPPLRPGVVALGLGKSSSYLAPSRFFSLDWLCLCIKSGLIQGAKVLD